MSGAQDPATYPGTDVLRNKLDIRDEGKLRQFEYAQTSLREADAPNFPMTAQGYKDTHKHLFGEVYDWAGESRTVNFRKGDSTFEKAYRIDEGLETRFQHLRWDKHLQGLAADRFSEKAADHIAELNNIHAFREGNGRTMRLHLEQLAGQAGLQLDRQQLPKEQWDDASARSLEGYRSDLTRVIAGAMTARETISTDEALTRSRELHGQAAAEIKDRLLEIARQFQQGRGTTVERREQTELRDELAALGSPDANRTTATLERLRAAGVQDVTVLTGQTTTARDQINAIAQGADRALNATERTNLTESASLAAAQPAKPEAAKPVATTSADDYWTKLGTPAAKPAADAPSQAPSAAKAPDAGKVAEPGKPLEAGRGAAPATKTTADDYWTKLGTPTGDSTKAQAPAPTQSRAPKLG